MHVVKALFREIVDYAGLFPPAGLPLDQVVSNYEEYLGGDERWMLARLILPASKIEAFEKLSTFTNSKHAWSISSLLPGYDAPDDALNIALNMISQFNQKYQTTGKAIIDAVEIKCPTVSSIVETIERIPDNFSAFLEIPSDEEPAERLNAIQDGLRKNTFAKIRTGGVTPDLIPTPQHVARFIRDCALHNVGFKATAGLHHPLRGDHRLTYDPKPEIGTMFGFANVFAAACFAFAGHADPIMLEDILTESNPDQLAMREDGLLWDDTKISIDTIARIRSSKAISFGSCSFEEPTSELRQLGWTTSQIA